MCDVVYSVLNGNSRLKKGGCTPGPRKTGVLHKRLSCMVVFRCYEDYFAMINPIKPKIGL